MNSTDSYRQNMARLRDRSTIDLLLLMIAGTICGMVIAGGVAAVVVELVHPETDSSRILVLLSDTLNTLIGLLAGFLAGRTDSFKKSSNEEEKP